MYAQVNISFKKKETHLQKNTQKPTKDEFLQHAECIAVMMLIMGLL